MAAGLRALLVHPNIFDPQVIAHPDAQQTILVQRVGELLSGGQDPLDSVCIDRFTRWIHLQWEESRKDALAPLASQLSASYPEFEPMWRHMVDRRTP
jgi:hypothetical protein